MELDRAKLVETAQTLDTVFMSIVFTEKFRDHAKSGADYLWSLIDQIDNNDPIKVTTTTLQMNGVTEIAVDIDGTGPAVRAYRNGLPLVFQGDAGDLDRIL